VIDYDAPDPPFRQLAAIIRGRIERAEIASRVPGERQLARDFGVAVVTVRKAMEVLRDEGLVRTEPGWGSFVIPPEERDKT
jgi:DNA-binding GntR family transcriptional regulator